MSGRYKMLESLGAGGAGAVFKAYDTQLDRYVAIKRLLTKQEEEQQDAQSSVLRKEAGSLATLQHPNIVSIYDLGSDEEGMFIVMELLEGETLADLIDAGPLSLQDFYELASQTLEGALYAHSLSILHRDLKPENIKVKRQPGGRLQVKIVDFGLARLSYGARKQTEDQRGNVLGSIFYMAPEQFLRQPLDGRTDLYSLGCVYYQALSGRRPFEHETMSGVLDMHLQHQVALLHDLRPELPERVCDWVMWLFSREPNDRPGNAQIALESLRTIRDQGGASNAPAPQPEVAEVNPAPADTAYQTGALTSALADGTTLPARKKNPVWIYIVTAVVLAGAGWFFWMLKTHSGGSRSKDSGRSDKALAPRPADFVSTGAILHWRAGVNMDAPAEPGKSSSMVEANDLIASWHGLVRDGGDASLAPFDQNKENFPRYIFEKPNGFKVGLGLARFGPKSALLHKMDINHADTKNYPFGSNTKVKGFTLVIVARPVITDKEIRVLRLINETSKSYVGVRATASNEIFVSAGVGDKWNILKLPGTNTRQFSVISVVWNGATNKLLLCARGQDGVKHGPVESAAPKGCSVLNEIRIGEPAAANADPKSIFQGDIAELMLWPFPMDAEQRTLMEQKLCEFYFETPGQRY